LPFENQKIAASLHSTAPTHLSPDGAPFFEVTRYKNGASVAVIKETDMYSIKSAFGVSQ
jgi:hypothetical protein